MTVSLRLNKEDEILIKQYAELKNMSFSELFRNAVLEQIEDEYDLESYKKAIEKYKKNPVTYTHEEVAKMLNLD